MEVDGIAATPFSTRKRKETWAGDRLYFVAIAVMVGSAPGMTVAFWKPALPPRASGVAVILLG